MDKAITKEKWAEIQENLAGYFAAVEFKNGDTKITIRRTNVAEGRTALAVYVDGYIRGAWTFPNGKEFRDDIPLYWRKRTSAAFSPKRKANIIKRLGKRLAQKTFGDLDKVLVHYDPLFNTAKTLVSQYKKIDGLELVSCGFGGTDGH
ncbi:hypothetical protein [Gallaecimonas mangrovi]|uniref:hypothetical protein n=1 Tax=Gallaecimonas mangrovi TaxID=2291597 RepID=UPI000E2026C5|nr:hypothetical protein [Gallaecimonas mangrovi]